MLEPCAPSWQLLCLHLQLSTAVHILKHAAAVPTHVLLCCACCAAPVAREVEDADDEEENDVAVEESLAPAKPVRAKKKAGGAPCQLSAGRDADLTKV